MAFCKVYFIWLFTLIVSLHSSLMCNAIRLHLSPDKCIATTENAVHISCVTDEVEDKEKEVTVMEISRNNDDPIVFLRHCSNVTYGDELSSKFQATGYIDNDVGKSHLNLTLSYPKSEDTGIYTCVMYYLDRKGHLHEERASSNLLVEKLDLSALETVLNQLKYKVSSLEKTSTDLNEKDSMVLDRVAVLEEKTKNQIQQINSLSDKVGHTVAFAATNNILMTTTIGKILILPDVVMQQGQGYDKKTGIFTAPRAGLYVFHVGVHLHHGCGMHMFLSVNDRFVAKQYAYDKFSWSHSAMNAVASLEVGDRVFSTMNNNGCKMSQDHYTMFTGYLIRAF